MHRLGGVPFLSFGIGVACQKSSIAFRAAGSLSERSEFEPAEKDTTNFWQRASPRR